MSAHMKAHPPVGLAELRRARGLSQERLGAAAGGVSAATIRRTERSETKPHPRTLAALAQALGCHPEDILIEHSPGGDRGCTHTTVGAVEEVGAHVAHRSG